METTISNRHSVEEPLNLLLIGNNPIEMGHILKKIHQIQNSNIITEIAFDLKTLFERLINFKPNFILIDDNIGKVELCETVAALAANRKTKDIPITVLKNSNYKEALGSTSILDYVLKQNLSSDSLLNTMKNALRFRRAQMHLFQAHKKRKQLSAVAS